MSGTDGLWSILRRYRAQVQPAWSEATSHPAFPAKQGESAGQCGVTSAWLQERLRDDHGLHTTYMDGYVQQEGLWEDADLGDRHCWLEFDGGVIDLTADQFGLPEVVCGAVNARYVGSPGVPDLDRLAKLKAALGEEGGG